MTPSEFWRSPGPFSPRELADVIRTSVRWVQERVQDGSIEAGTIMPKGGKRGLTRIAAREARRVALALGAEPPEEISRAERAQRAERAELLRSVAGQAHRANRA